MPSRTLSAIGRIHRPQLYALGFSANTREILGISDLKPTCCKPDYFDETRAESGSTIRARNPGPAANRNACAAGSKIMSSRSSVGAVVFVVLLLGIGFFVANRGEQKVSEAPAPEASSTTSTTAGATIIEIQMRW